MYVLHYPPFPTKSLTPLLDAVEPGVCTLDASCTSTGAASSLATAKAWLDDCTFNHLKCSTTTSAESTWKPTHLLDVTIRGPKGSPGVRLVDGMFLSPLTEYVTLSHCWGSSKPLRLNKTTLPALRHGVATATLPQTFADACAATLALGLRYLWIDALCIQHDSAPLVLKELSSMSRIFAEATCNLAATAAKNDAAGLFSERNVAALQPAVVELEAGKGVDPGVYKVLRSTVWADLVERGPLLRRAWVFQERALAKRTVHFGRMEVLFECQQMCCSEVFPRGLPSNGVGAGEGEWSKRTHHQKVGNWGGLVREYSRGRLSYGSDKLLAIAGMTAQYAARNRLRGTDYLVGLWRGMLPGGLLWKVDKGRGARVWRAPSWSWASLDGVVTLPEQVVGKQDHCVEVVEVDVKGKMEGGVLVDPLLGQVESASLKIRGFLLKGILLRTHDYWGRTACVLQTPRSQVEIESAWFDERLAKLSAVNGALTEQLEVYCLPVLESVDRIEGLLLCATPVKGKKGWYRRIGTFDISRYDQIAWGAFRENMRGDESLNGYEERLRFEGGVGEYTYTINIV
jgi:hypothetical protein